MEGLTALSLDKRGGGILLGYVRAYKPEMKFKDYELYKGVYCTLCKSLGKRYGLPARFILSYDFTFFSMVRMAVRENCPGFKASRCSFNPAKKCLDCNRDNEDIAYTADVSILMMYHKLCDNIEDSKLFKRTLCKILMPYAKHLYKKACARVGDIYKVLEAQMSRQSSLEKNNASLDEAADPSAVMLSELLGYNIECNDIDSLKKFGYMVGRWVYITDAAHDCEDDIKDGSFNPLQSRFGSENFAGYCEEMMNLTIGEAILCYKRLKIFRFDDILTNVLYDGVYSVTKKVLKGEYNREKSV